MNRKDKEKEIEFIEKYIINCLCQTDEELDTIYRYAYGNSACPLHNMAINMSFSQFVELWRSIEKKYEYIWED